MTASRGKTEPKKVSTKASIITLVVMVALVVLVVELLFNHGGSDKVKSDETVGEAAGVSHAEPTATEARQLVVQLVGQVPGFATQKDQFLIMDFSNECQQVLAGSPSIAQAKARFQYDDTALTDDQAQVIITAVRSSAWCK